ncbi:hypothetical protein [Curvivirga sp.]|uniref:hypothetical protein n=1 Tax=Curvivirga sp. TaxID=2856848 RepID=UPI003B5966CE
MQSNAQKNKFDDLAKLALEGNSVHIYLKPDADVKDRDGTSSYIESLDLRHLIIKDNDVWACQDRNVSQFVDETITYTSGYAYSNALDMFVNFRATDQDLLSQQDAQQRILLMTTGRYQELEWICHNDYELVWEYGNTNGYSHIIEAIKAGKKFKLALQDQAGFWNIHPVYYPFYYPDDDDISFLTCNNNLPALFKTPISSIVDFWQEKSGYPLDAHNPALREISLELTSPGYWTCYKVTGHGVYQTIKDRKEHTARKYKACKIFASSNS